MKAENIVNLYSVSVQTPDPLVATATELKIVEDFLGHLDFQLYIRNFDQKCFILYIIGIIGKSHVSFSGV